MLFGCCCYGWCDGCCLDVVGMDVFMDVVALVNSVVMNVVLF